MAFREGFNPSAFPDWAWFLEQWKNTLIKLDEIGEDNERRLQAAEQLANDLKTFVNSYFDNLDVQREINNKIDSLVASGRFLQVVEPTVAANVTEWLLDNITEPEGVVIDTSLTVSGACADAKAVGDRLVPVENSTAFLTAEVASHEQHLDRKMTPVSVYNGYAKANGTLTANNSYIAYTYNVTPGQELLIGFYYGYEAMGFDCYFDDTFVAWNYSKPTSDELKVVRYTVPTNVNKIIVNTNITAPFKNGFYGVYVLSERDFAPSSYFKGFFTSYGSSNASVNARYTTLFYTVEPNTLYRAFCWYGWSARGVTLWNGDTFITSYLGLNNGENNDGIIVYTPNNCNKIGVTCKTDTDVNGLYGLYKIEKTEYSDKKWCALGDSLTEINTRAECNYYKFALANLGMTYYNNMGVSGTGYAKTSDKFYSRIDSIENVDFDIMTIFGSGNDLSSGVPLGTYTDEGTSTMAGYINKAITSFFTKAPTKKLALITPTPWDSYCNGNLSGVMDDYANMIVAVAKYRGVPVLDLFHLSGIRPWDSAARAVYYGTDGVHPNTQGHKDYIAPQVTAFLKTLL